MNVQPQPVLTQLTRSAIFVTADINPGGEDKVREMVSNWGGYTRAVGFRRLDGGLAPVVGIGSHAWDRLFSGPRPMNLHPFTEIRGEKHTAPATGGDLLFHVRAVDFDLCFAFMQRCSGHSVMPSPSLMRCTGSATSTSVTCSASSTVRRTRAVRPPTNTC
ncbi:Dyp-type peroxidase [Naumannella halotolerans]|uniref:Dyp-type peroxidase n=1 Tax=Naumannella halotolerans TaxID=993414 RepID=UPI00370DDC3F